MHRALDFGSVFGCFWLLTSLAGHGFGERESALALIAALIFLLTGQATGLYPRWKSPDIRSEVAAIAGTWLVTIFVLLALGFPTRYGETFPRLTVLAWVPAAPLIDAASRIAVRLFESPSYGVDGMVKRFLDLTLAMLALAVAALPMAIIAAIITLTSPGPVLFGQRRYGLDGREIRIWKFRSMRVCDDGPTVKQAMKQDPRVMSLGRI